MGICQDISAFPSRTPPTRPRGPPSSAVPTRTHCTFIRRAMQWREGKKFRRVGAFENGDGKKKREEARLHKTSPFHPASPSSDPLSPLLRPRHHLSKSSYSLSMSWYLAMA